MEIFSKSNIGTRKENQDRYDSGVIPSLQAAWAVVCDGMGGAKGGSIASSIAVSYIGEQTAVLIPDLVKMNEKDLSDKLKLIVEEANRKIFDEACRNVNLTGMGTTCEFIFISNHHVHVVHVGDSRTYLVKKDEIIQLTEDHSVVQEMVKRKELTQAQAENHPNKHFITRALGIRYHVFSDVYKRRLHDDDILLICTDGLSNYVTPEEISEVFRQEKGEEAAEALVNRALLAGGSDNITVTIIYSEPVI